MLQIPVHNITQNTINHQNRNNNNINTNQDNNSSLSTSDTHITQPFPTQHPSPRIYDPLPIQPQNSTQTTPHKSP